MPDARDQKIRDILTSTRTIALVGASDKPDRPANRVMRSLLGLGYDVHPVNPRLAGQEIHGRTVVATVADVPVPIDMVEIFMRSELVAPIVDDAIAAKAKTVWMQLGVTDETAAETARAAGLEVVMDACPMIEGPRLGIF